MPRTHDDLLSLIAKLRELAKAPRGDATIFKRIVAITEWIERTASAPGIAAKAVDVRFKSEDVFAREHSMPEAVLREMLAARLNSLEAEVRAAAPVIPVTFDRRRSPGRRWTDMGGHARPSYAGGIIPISVERRRSGESRRAADKIAAAVRAVS